MLFSLEFFVLYIGYGYLYVLLYLFLLNLLVMVHVVSDLGCVAGLIKLRDLVVLLAEVWF